MKLMRRPWLVLLAASIIAIIGCRTAQKRPKLPAPPVPPATPNSAVLRLQSARELQKPSDTDFPSQARADITILLVKRKGPATERTVAEFHRKHGGKISKFKHIKWEAVKLPKGQEAKLFRVYKDSGLFEHVQFQNSYSGNLIPNDPLLNQQWAVVKIEAEPAWDIPITNEVIVAVIDTGIDYSHPDLRDNLWTGPQREHGYTAKDGVIVPGGREDHYHGTHVSGIVAALRNNAVGIAGLGGIKLASFKFLHPDGLSIDAVLCLEKIIDLKKAGHNIRVTNNSWGGVGQDQFLEDAFRALEENGILSVCAAGNESVDNDVAHTLPSSFPLDGIVSVLASSADDELSWFSNYGMTSTDLLAPGHSILSCSTNATYVKRTGTSMAAPHVAAATAMLFGRNPSLTVAQAKTILLSPESYDQTKFVVNTTGGGRLNLNKVLSNPGVTNPPSPNRPPTARLSTQTNFLVVPIGAPTTITAIGSDPDVNPLFYYTTATAFDDGWIPEEWWEKPHFAFSEITNRVTVSTLPLALDQNIRLQFGVTDKRGGAVLLKQSVWSYRVESLVKDISTNITGFKQWFDSAGACWFSLNTASARESEYMIEVYPATVPSRVCCGIPNQDFKTDIQFPSPGAYSARAYLIDKDGNFTTSPQATIIVSNSPLTAPTAKVVLNVKRGTVPLHIVGDMSQSLPGSSVQLKYAANFWTQNGASSDMSNPRREFTLTEPGVYEIQFTCWDTVLPLEDRVVEFVTALPAIAPNMSIELIKTVVRISWMNGILQEAPTVTGPWTDSSSQNNPQTRPAAGSSRFFRMR